MLRQWWLAFIVAFSRKAPGGLYFKMAHILGGAAEEFFEYPYAPVSNQNISGWQAS